MTAVLPPQFALAAYQVTLAGRLDRPKADEPAATEDRGSLLDLVLSPRLASVRRPHWLAGLPTTYALPLTAASG
jgi:hypothetical protein